jgi:hypothetical protein
MWRAAIMTATLGLSTTFAFAEPVASKDASSVVGNEITPQLEAAVERGLKYLAGKQNKRTGCFGPEGGADTGITALAAIAFMSDGNLPGRGLYGENVQLALDYTVARTQESGLIGGSDSHAVMYSHGFATLFLAEVYGMTGDELVKEKLQKAIQLIHRSQNAQGGWRYQPAPVDADVSVTICQVMALRAARDAGVKVERQVIDKAIEYVKACQNDDGGFNYMLGQGSGSLFPRSAAGVATLFYAGISEGKEIDRGLAYLNRFRPGPGGDNEAIGGFYFYGHYYAVQTMFLAGGDNWKRWFPAIRKELLDRQRPDGSWDGEQNSEYCTSMALIILQMPKRYLPVYSGKGPGS